MKHRNTAQVERVRNSYPEQAWEFVMFKVWERCPWGLQLAGAVISESTGTAERGEGKEKIDRKLVCQERRSQEKGNLLFSDFQLPAPPVTPGVRTKS